MRKIPTLDSWKGERSVRRTLRQLSEQRVRDVEEQHKVWMIDNAVTEGDKETKIAIRTCILRGWVEVQSGPLGEWQLTPMESPGPDLARIYRLTEAGWNVLHRTHEWVIATFSVAIATLIATVTGIFLA